MFRPRNHPQQVAARGAIDEVDDRRTPEALFRVLDARYAFCTDAAASEDNAKKAAFWTLGDSGLEKGWHGRRVWCNPPYSALRAWVEKAAMREADLAVLLLPANRTEQPFWHEIVEPMIRQGNARYYFLRKRWNFAGPLGAPKNVPFGLVVLEVWGGRSLFPWERQTEIQGLNGGQRG